MNPEENKVQIRNLLQFSNALVGLRLIGFYRESHQLEEQELKQWELKIYMKLLWKEKIREKVFELGWEKQTDLEGLERKIDDLCRFDEKLEDLVRWMLDFNENQRVSGKGSQKVDIVAAINKKFHVNLKVSKGMVNQLLKKAKLLQENQQYAFSLKILNHLNECIDDERGNYLWGKMENEILLGRLEDGWKSMQELNEWVEKNGSLEENRHAYVLNKCQILHSGLFLFFTQNQNLKQQENFIDFMTSSVSSTVQKMEPHKGMITTIQNVGPHLVRYIAAFQFMNKSYQQYGQYNLNYFSKLLSEAVEYQDPLTKFICAIIVDFDFEVARQQLPLIKQTCTQDFYLNKFSELVFKGAEEFFFENYCKVYSHISLKDFTYFFNVPPEKLENWVVSQLKNTNIKAKINESQEKLEIIQTQYNYHDNIISRLKDILPRTKLIDENLQKTIIAQENNKKK